jgi:hypothetical protein
MAHAAMDTMTAKVALYIKAQFSKILVIREMLRLLVCGEAVSGSRYVARQ